MSNRRRMGLTSFALGLSAIASGRGEPASQPAKLTIQPIAYFEQSCARCHGDYGSNYGDQFARNLDDAKLSKVVEDMCSGPGNAPLSGVDLEAEIAFHRALADRKPFICVEARDGETVSGEVTPGATLTADVDGKSSSIAVSEIGAWSAKISDHSTLTAKLKDQSTTLQLDAASFFSHAEAKH